METYIPDSPLVELSTQVSKAYDKARRMFSNVLTGGTHSIKLKYLPRLFKYMNIQPDQVFWEIGMGEPLLAFALSAASQGGQVVATDLGNKPQQ